MSTSEVSAPRRRVALGVLVAMSAVFAVLLAWRAVEALRGAREFPYLGSLGGVTGFIVVWRTVLADRRDRAPARSTPAAR